MLTIRHGVLGSGRWTRWLQRAGALAALGAGLWLTCSAGAEVTLPAGALAVRFDAITAFDTTYEPFIDVTTGALVAPLPADGPLELNAFGEVEQIFDAADSSNQGLIAGELTFAYTGGILTPLGPPSLLASSPTSRTYSVNSTISGGTLTYYDDPLTGGTLDLNTATFFGDPAVIPAVATDGTPYLVASAPPDIVGAIVITYFRPNAAANFNRYTISLQVANGGMFTITGGDVLLDMPGAFGQSVLASQLGPFSANFATEVADGVTRNQAVDALIEGSFEMRFAPEPASLSLLGLAATMLLVRRREG